ncbi:MAG: ABC transporter ATP-binding protein [Firmicutes bacterium HGW-Firmicutes-14]|jgi:NitT/TauT family transport system ATP-binding protein|nr:MAG: ABC transporter ATP-binding protein [Firmicutes bacterium HGW-Firmicutes-14]
MSFIIRRLNKSFDSLEVFKEFNIAFPENRVTCILGPSGCGKTTLLNIISGTVKPDSGEFSGLAGKRISYIYQEPRLLPWKTVIGNIEFVLKDVYPKRERKEQANRFMETVGLVEFAGFYPGQLSGGMKQRVAIARAFAYPSDILLMDEPFKSIDMELRESLVREFKNLWAADQRTVILVTHDREEALSAGHEIYILTGPPAALAERVIVTE